MTHEMRIAAEEQLTSSTSREIPPPARSAGRIQAVDLVVLIESSGAMKDVAETFTQVVGTAIQLARMKSPVNLRVIYLGTEGVFPYTVFMVSLRGYLTLALRVDDALLSSCPRRQRTGGAKGQLAGIEGGAANALLDVAVHFDWRPGAARNVLFLGDQPLGGARSPTPAGKDDTLGAARRVIEVARQRGVRLHMCPAISGSRCGAEARARPRAGVEAEYARVAVETGGRSSVAQESLSACLAMLEDVLDGSMTDPRIAAAESMLG